MSELYARLEAKVAQRAAPIIDLLDEYEQEIVECGACPTPTATKLRGDLERLVEDELRVWIATRDRLVEALQTARAQLVTLGGDQDSDDLVQAFVVRTIDAARWQAQDAP